MVPTREMMMVSAKDSKMVISKERKLVPEMEARMASLMGELKAMGVRMAQTIALGCK